MTRHLGPDLGRAKRVLAVVSLLCLVVAGFGAGVADRLAPYSQQREVDEASESARAAERVADAAGLRIDSGVAVIVDQPGGFGSPAARARLARVERTLRATPQIAAIRSPSERRERERLTAEDGLTAAVLGAFGPLPAIEHHDAALAIEEALDDVPGVRVGGDALSLHEGTRLIEHDLPVVEGLSLPVVLLLSFWFFRGMIAAAIPPLLGGLAIGATLGALRALSEVMDVSVFALNLVTALALGLAIDYTLLIVSRFREELAADPGRPVADALAATYATAGRTVLFSALTVAASLSALLAFPQPFLHSMAVGGMIVTVIAGALALVMLPAILAVVGRRIDGWAPARLQRASAREARPEAAGAWYRVAHLVVRRPLPVAVVVTALLLLVASPALDLRVAAIDGRGLPEDSVPRLVEERLHSGFEPGIGATITLVAAPAQAAEARRLARDVPGVAAVGRVRPAGAGTALVSVEPAGRARDVATERVVERLRALPVEGLDVGGRTAALLDERDTLTEHAPLAALIGIAATMLLVFLLTGSVILPLKTVLMNALTVAAAFGVLVWVFQEGRLQGVLDYSTDGGVIAPVLVFVAALSFGLSTDYGVFVLARMKEAREQGLGEREAVAAGLERTGRVVTSAALLLTVALGALAAVRVVTIKETAVGMVAAILVDAFLVRALLVPALMGVLGRSNWWAPAPLARLHRRVGLREAPATAGTRPTP